MAESSSVNKAMAIGGLVFQAAILGLLIWLVYKAYQCGTDNSMCSTFIYSIIRTGTKYDKYSGLVPFSNIMAIDDTKVTSANTCADWCTKTYGCNGFVWNNKTCGQLTDTSSVLLIPSAGNDTYIVKDVDHPTAGFVARPEGEDFSSNVAQKLGSMLVNTNPTSCAASCKDQALTGNCIGFSMLTSNNCQLVSNISNVVTTAGVQSYVWTMLSSSNYTEAKF